MFSIFVTASLLLLFHVSKANQELNRSLRHNEKLISSRSNSEINSCSQQTTPKKKIICFYRIEEHFRPYDLNPCLCTHIIYSNVAVRENSAFVAGKKGDLFFLSALKTQNPKLKVLVSLRFTGKTLLDSMSSKNPSGSAYNELVYNKFANRVRDFIVSHGIDGIDLDLKYLTDNDPQFVVKDALSSLIKSLRHSFQQKTSINIEDKELLISITCSKYPKELTEHYDFINIKKFVNFVNIPAFHFEGDDRIVRHPARLHGISDMENLDSIVDLTLALGLPEEQIIIGVPAFGVYYKLYNATQTTPGSTINTVKANNSIFAYSKICTIRDNSSWTMVREKDLTAPYIFYKDNWIGFDDEISIKLKVKYSILRNLGGVALWAVNDDDTVGKCGFGSFPLLNTIFEVLSESNVTRNYDSSFAVIEKYGNVERIVEMEDEETDSHLECKRPGYIQNPKDCSRFYRCVKFDNKDKLVNKFQYGCPTGLVFDEMNEICNWPSWSSSCQGSGEIMKINRKKFTCQSYGYFQDPENCEYFFYCSDFGKGNFQGYQFKCPFNLAFDEEKLLCNWKWLVKGCSLEIDSKQIDINAKETPTTDKSYEKSVESSEDFDDMLSRSDTIENPTFVDTVPAEHRNEEFITRKSFARVIKDQITGVIDSIDSKVKHFFGYSTAQKRQDESNRFANWFSSITPFGSPQLINSKVSSQDKRVQTHHQRLTGEDPFVSIPVIDVMPNRFKNEKSQNWNRDNNLKLSHSVTKNNGESEFFKISPSKEVIALSKTQEKHKPRVQSVNKLETIPIPIFTLRNSNRNLQQIQRRPDGSDLPQNLFSTDSSRHRKVQQSQKNQQSFEVRNIMKNNGEPMDSTANNKPQKNIVRQQFNTFQTVINSQMPQVSNRLKWPQASPDRNRIPLPSQPLRGYKDPQQINYLRNQGSQTLNSNKPLTANMRPQELPNFDIDIKQFDLQAASVEDALESDSYLHHPKVTQGIQRLPFSTESLHQKNRPQNINTQPVPQVYPHNLKNSAQRPMVHVPQKIRQYSTSVHTPPKQSHYGINVPESTPRYNHFNPVNRHTTLGTIMKNGFIPVTHNPKAVTPDSVKLWKQNGKTLQTSSSSLDYSVYKENNPKAEGEDKDLQNNKMSPLDVVTINNLSKNSKPGKTPQLLIIPVPDNHPKAQSFEDIQKMQSLYPELFSDTFNYNKNADFTTEAVTVPVRPVSNESTVNHTKQNQQKPEKNYLTEDNSEKPSISTHDGGNLATASEELSSTTARIQLTDQKKIDENQPPNVQKQSVTSSEENLLATHHNLSQSLYDSIQQVIAQHINSQLKNIDFLPKITASTATVNSFNSPVTTSAPTSRQYLQSSTEFIRTKISQSTPAPQTQQSRSTVHYNDEILEMKTKNDENTNRKWVHQPSWYQYHHQIASLPVLNSNISHRQALSEGMYPVYSNLENRFLNSDYFSTTKIIAGVPNGEKQPTQHLNSQRLYYKDVESKIPLDVSTEALIVDKPVEILRTKANTPNIQVYIVQGDRQAVKSRTVANEDTTVKVFVFDESNDKSKHKKNENLENEKKLSDSYFGEKKTESANKNDNFYYTDLDSKSTQKLNTATKVSIIENDSNIEPETEDVEYEDTVGLNDEKLTASHSIPTNKKQSLQSIYNSHPKLRNFTENSLPESACSRPGLFQHPRDCNKFYECYWDKYINKYTLHSFDCPVKLAFDSRIIGCSSPTDSTVCVQY